MILDIVTAFMLGLGTPLVAVCVLPLYPGFLAYLSNKSNGKALHLSLMVTLGVIVFMTLLGIIFSMLLEISLTKVVGVVSPVAFGILGIISLLLIFDYDFSKIFPQITSPTSKNPWLEAFFFGFFFGAIVVPCSPGLIAALFVKTLGIGRLLENVLQFFFFGLGIGFPLILLSAISSSYSSALIKVLTKNKKVINRVTGLIMLVISLYYLIYVFKVF